MNIYLEIIYALLLLLSYFALGNLVLSKLRIKSKFEVALLVGAGVYALGVTTLSILLGIKYYTIVSLGIPLLIFFYDVLKRKLEIEAVSFPVLLLVFLCLNFIVVLYPSSYFDPLNYHLYGIVEWLKLDHVSHIKSAIQLMHVSFADYIYFPVGLLTGVNSLDHLQNLQVISQILSFSLGITCFSLVLNSWLQSRWTSFWKSFLIVAMIFRASLHHKGLIAKNDWIALSWFIAGFYMIFESGFEDQKKRYLGATFIGLSVGAKFTYLPAVVIGFFAYGLTRPGQFKTIFKLVLVSVLISSPYFIRNLIWTGNPIFPMGTKVFATDLLGPSWLEGLNFFDMKLNEFSWDLLQNKLFRIFTYEPITYFYLLVPFFYRKIDKSLLLAWLAVTGFLILFIFVVGTHSEIRHFGPIALAINGFGVLSLFLICEQLRLTGKWTYALGACFIVNMFVNMVVLDDQLNPVPSAVQQGNFSPRNLTLIKEKKGLVLSAALPGILSKKSKLALLDDTPPFYFSHHSIVRLWDDPVIDTSLNNCGSSLNCMVTQLQKWEITHLIETGTMFDPYYRPSVQLAFRIAMSKYPEIVIFKSNGENLISIKKLSDIINGNEL